MPIYLICFAGIPITKDFGLTFFVTTDPAATNLFSLNYRCLKNHNFITQLKIDFVSGIYLIKLENQVIVLLGVNLPTYNLNCTACSEDLYQAFARSYRHILSVLQDYQSIGYYQAHLL